MWRAIRNYLPWCVGARVLSRDEQVLVADLTIGFRMFRETFRSRVGLNKPGHIHVTYENGPFRYLNNHWRFTAGRWRDRGGFLRGFRIPQPHSAGGNWGGVQ